MNTTKQRLFAVIAAISLLLSTLLLSACNIESPSDKGSDPVENDIFDDASQQADTNPNTDPDGLSVITDAVVVSARHNLGTDRVIFVCAAILVGYPNGYSPFEFSVPASAVGFTGDEIAFDQLKGKLIDIEFSGIFQESYPMGAAGVTKVTYSGQEAQQDVYNECFKLFAALTESADLKNCVVVSVRYRQETDTVSFDCAAIFYGGNDYTPFRFGVHASEIEFTSDRIAYEELVGKLIDIEFSGEILESYPAQLQGVTKATYSGLSAEQDVLDECIALFYLEGPEEVMPEPVPVNNCIVVSAEFHRETGNVGFKCAAVLLGYGSEYTPFTFSLPASAVEFTADKIAFDKLEGKLIDIEFSGQTLDSNPLGLEGVTKVTYSGASVEQKLLDECKELFNVEEVEEEPMPVSKPKAEPTVDNAVSVSLKNCVVVSAKYYLDFDKVIFNCAAIFNDGDDYSPFMFDVPASAIEFNADKIAIDKLEGKLIDIEYISGTLGASIIKFPTVTKATYNGLSAGQDVFYKCQDIFDNTVLESVPDDSFDDPQSCIQPVFIVDNAYIVRTEEMWDGENASILAYAQVGTCGMKDLVEIVLPKKNIKDENGKVVSVSDIEVGRCIEFAFKKISEGEAGSPVFHTDGIDYFTVKSESVEVSEETIKSALDAYAIE